MSADFTGQSTAPTPAAWQGAELTNPHAAPDKASRVRAHVLRHCGEP